MIGKKLSCMLGLEKYPGSSGAALEVYDEANDPGEMGTLRDDDILRSATLKVDGSCKEVVSRRIFGYSVLRHHTDQRPS